MSDEEHVRLAKLLHSVKGKVAISGYHCDLMDELYKDWFCVEAPVKKCHSSKSSRKEVLWLNYDPREALEGNFDYGLQDK
jgi:DNA adenine methylase